MTADLVKTERADPLALVQLALEKGCSPADLTGLYDLAKRWRDDQAAEAYAKAITGFKSECPRIIKANPVVNKAGATIYKFARYEDIKLITGPLETKYGIVVSFDLPNAANGVMSGICRLTVGCHSVETHFSCRVPEVPNANEPQNDGACLSYFKRLSYCAALDIVIAGEDNNVQGGGVVSKEQVEILADLVKRVVGNPARFYEWLQIKTGADDLLTIPAAHFEAVKQQLTLWGNKQRQNGGPK